MYMEVNQGNDPVVLKNVSKKHLTETGKKNWLSYWKHFNRKNSHQCATHNCQESHHHGVLVKKSTCATEKLFVVPVCKHCSNSATDTLKVDSKFEIISADLSL